MYRLTNAWGYKYPDGKLADGIGLHSDFAAINVNCWITAGTSMMFYIIRLISPSIFLFLHHLYPLIFIEDTVEEDTGGMLIWPVYPPRNWNNTEYNPLELYYAEEREGFIRISIYIAIHTEAIFTI